MSPFIEARREAWRLSRTLRSSLMNGEGWAHYAGTRLCFRGKIDILITRHRLRFLDQINVFFDEAEVWLPLIARIPLRTAVRLFMLERANEWLET
jgi:hypothetical protein